MKRLNIHTDKSYRFSFNGMEKDDEVKGQGNSYDFGARMFDARVGRWLSRDVRENEYPKTSPYVFVENKTTIAYDPDGELIIFINGYNWGRQMKKDRRSSWDELKYWHGINFKFMKRLDDYNTLYVDGSGGEGGPASQRYEMGKEYGKMHIKAIKSGEIELAKGETIKIVSHSHGAAFAEGYAEELIAAGYTVEVMYNLAPHQPQDVTVPEGVLRAVQYSHPFDLVSSKQTPGMQVLLGTSKDVPIEGIDEYLDFQQIQPDAFSASSSQNRGGHNIELHEYIFTKYEEGTEGYVAPRNDKGQPQFKSEKELTPENSVPYNPKK